MAVGKSTSNKGKESPRRTAGLAEMAFQRLQQAILTGELREGERVRESRLAVEWAIGITPLREAVRRMAAMGYLVLKPNHAPMVRKIGVKDIQQIYEIREALESIALRATWEGIAPLDLEKIHTVIAKVDNAPSKATRLRAQFALDDELHHLWIAPKENPWLADDLERLMIYRPNLTQVMGDHSHFVEEAFAQHKQILRAIEQRQLTQALRLLARHIQRSGYILASVSQP
ncbi:GntR family transcriptional regulator [soil metagenome]